MTKCWSMMQHTKCWSMMQQWMIVTLAGLFLAGCVAAVPESRGTAAAATADADLRAVRALAPPGAFADLDPSTACIVGV